MIIKLFLPLLINGFAFAQPSYCPQNTKPIVELEELGKKASAEDLNTLGEMYHFGCSVNQDFRRAHNSYVQAVEKGSAVAANHLGRIYLNGEGVKADPKIAEKWYKKSVELDMSEENRCKNGQHPDKDFCALLELSQTGNAQAMAAIGEIYLSGITHGQETIVKPDPTQAKKWLKKAAKNANNPKTYWLLYTLCKKELIPCEGAKEIEKWRKKGIEAGGSSIDFQ